MLHHYLHPGNARDGIFLDVSKILDRELILVDFTPIKESKAGELAANFDIVLGRTPDDRSNHFSDRSGGE